MFYYIDLHEPKTNRNNLIMNSGDDFAFFPSNEASLLAQLSEVAKRETKISLP